ncbi:hypothetical protein COCC4DRAFT_130105 [Bipolaris maydis ATCC 48331]|uniref:Uncharacterized protein n=2 Tax=Cochliobolus heterostrophus TaxID=5016 RepID=M2UWN3_COCH5|nr:uncharacterized protein COCC4DRAFT_130105 [Bipolaris maydis ATCC 48331]EMD92217.1 hypothetical protein COCHEDRAFT_1213294 [Bipolaris maydis C5]KAH7550843.1 hypothetical protein BM1_10216 [Bipolaris maydis]ENI07911.1 hypothetical protein COCC4DRAFT_130105 [Bipolaris maydis ATCC 48331]KAJ5022073.1 hypothetical protein J3E73DRAFT_374333 [Bipolaris maydis]KAJ6210021.1 hypothetical protein PSV09DRAFT_1213294 [Bipolaris maydis]
MPATLEVGGHNCHQRPYPVFCISVLLRQINLTVASTLAQSTVQKHCSLTVASAHPYAGPMSLKNFKQVTPIKKAFLASSLVTPQSKVASPRTKAAMTTSEQVAVISVQTTIQHNSNTELAIAHGKALKQEMDKYAAKFSAVTCGCHESININLRHHASLAL